MHRHATGHFGHGREQRQTTTCVRHGFIGDGNAVRLQQACGLLGIGREMEIGEQQLTGTQHGDFRRLRLLHLHDHIGPREHVGGRGHDLGTGSAIHVVGEADGSPRMRLHDDLVAVGDEFAHARGREAHAILMHLYFFRNADKHVWSPDDFR